MSAGEQGCDVCVLLGSSDNTADVGAQIATAFDAAWPDCPYRRFVALSSERCVSSFPGWTPLVAGSTAGWAEELRAAVGLLPAELRSVILVLDDFLFLKRVETHRLTAIVDIARTKRLPYLRLKPVARSAIVGLLGALRRRTPIERLSPSEPYYTSLQVAVWDRTHLLAMLESADSIWDFEHKKVDGVHHFAVTANTISYRHVVEKGKWLPDTKNLFKRAGADFSRGTRPMWSKYYGVRRFVGNLRFLITGYSVVKLRRQLRKSGAETK